jgi:DNA-binding NarL/FixJ family response regulator
VLLVGMPRMLMDIVKDIISDEEDIALVGEVAGCTRLVQAATQTRADVVVLGRTGPGGNDDYRDLLYRRPRLKVLAIAADGRRAFLHELQPRVVALGEISPASLVEAIREGAPPRPAVAPGLEAKHRR